MCYTMYLGFHDILSSTFEGRVEQHKISFPALPGPRVELPLGSPNISHVYVCPCTLINVLLNTVHKSASLMRDFNSSRLVVVSSASNTQKGIINVTERKE